MDEKQIKAAAFALAEKQPDLNGYSAFPPQSWRVEGEEIVVLCADGRKVRGPLAQIKKPAPSPVMALPVHASVSPEKTIQPGKKSCKK